LIFSPSKVICFELFFKPVLFWAGFFIASEMNRALAATIGNDGRRALGPIGE
jgi:hypothetical protein